jgi:integrase
MLPVPRPDPGVLASAAREYVRQSKSANTLRAYQADWRDFTAFCEREGQSSLPCPAPVVASYLIWLADTQKRKTGTLVRRLSAISQAHQAAGYPAPTAELSVRAVLAGIRRVHGSEQASKQPLLPDTLKLLLEHVSPGLAGLRDQALLLLGFAGGFRRSELVALQVRDLEHLPEGVLVTVRRSKGDPEGLGQKVGIPRGRHAATCPVLALERWLAAAEIREGFVFRSTAPWTGAVRERGLEAKRVATLIQQLARKAGLDARQYGGHSLRSGLATAAAAGGAPERAIMEQTRHRSASQVRRYIRRGSVFRDNAAAFTGI